MWNTNWRLCGTAKVFHIRYDCKAWGCIADCPRHWSDGLFCMGWSFFGNGLQLWLGYIIGSISFRHHSLWSVCSLLNRAKIHWTVVLGNVEHDSGRLELQIHWTVVLGNVEHDSGRLELRIHWTVVLGNVKLIQGDPNCWWLGSINWAHFYPIVIGLQDTIGPMKRPCKLVGFGWCSLWHKNMITNSKLHTVRWAIMLSLLLVLCFSGIPTGQLPRIWHRCHHFTFLGIHIDRVSPLWRR